MSRPLDPERVKWLSEWQREKVAYLAEIEFAEELAADEEERRDG